MMTGKSNISVVIPVLNDGVPLDFLLRQLREISPDIEIIIADGGKSEEVLSICRKHYSTWIPSPRGRGVQMNRGAAAARGEILWFLHADSTIHPDSLRAIRQAMSHRRTAGGAFRFHLHQRHWYALILDYFVELRSQILNLPYGDQGFFVRRTVFDRMNGYREFPFLEDVDFIRRLKGEGRIAMLQVPIGVSSRRWEREGYLFVTVRNLTLTFAFFLGVHPDRLIRWYRPEAKPAEGAKRVPYSTHRDGSIPGTGIQRIET